MYKPVFVCCVAHVQCTDGYIHFMKCTDIAEPGMYIDISFWIQLFYVPGSNSLEFPKPARPCPETLLAGYKPKGVILAGWPAGWDWLLPGVTPIHVQAH
jgi:hypothetical protein